MAVTASVRIVDSSVKTTTARNMSNCEYAEVCDPDVPHYDGLVVTRLGDSLASLCGSHKWSGVQHLDLRVRLLPPGTKIEITVG